jgi:hypothetical protein
MSKTHSFFGFPKKLKTVDGLLYICLKNSIWKCGKMHFTFVCLNDLGVSGKYHPDWIKLSVEAQAACMPVSAGRKQNKLYQKTKLSK